MAALPGVTRAAVNFAAATLTVEGRFDARAVTREAAAHDGVVARPEGAPPETRPSWTRRLNAIRTILSGLGLLAGWIAEWTGAPSHVTVPLFAATMLIGGYATIRAGPLPSRRGTRPQRAGGAGPLPGSLRWPASLPRSSSHELHLQRVDDHPNARCLVRRRFRPKYVTPYVSDR